MCDRSQLGHQHYRQTGISQIDDIRSGKIIKPVILQVKGRITIKYLILFFIRIYQYTLSPVMGGACRFYPSCSEYAYEAVKRYGAIKGSILALKRILKCHPFHPGGVDPVP